MKSILQKLKEPFPQQKETKKSIINIIGVGMFITLFLFVFRPFGLDGVTSKVFLVCLSFGFVTIVFAIVFDLIAKYVLKIRTDLPSWTLGKWIIQSLVLLCWVALGNYILIYIFNFSSEFNFTLYLVMARNTIMIGIFPIIFSGLMAQMKAIKKYKAEANDIQLFKAENTNTTFTLIEEDNICIGINQILYIEAQQNYISVCYLDNDQFKNTLIRKPISKVESELLHSSLIRCHRSYIINTNQVDKVSGNAQGLKAKMKKNIDLEIPISRSYIQKFKNSFV